MPTYVMLSTLTPDGVQTIKNNPQRIKEVNREVEQLGATVVRWQRWAQTEATLQRLIAWAEEQLGAPAELPHAAEPGAVKSELSAEITRLRADFVAAMDDDFNTSRALGALFNLAGDFNGFKDSLAAPQAVGTVEEIVPVLTPQAGAIVIPGWVVGAVAEAPGGAAPSYAHGYYDRDNSLYKEWDSISRDRERFAAWMADNVLHGVPAG